ncbi:hypothetical protein GGS24DRAFT_51962 [Hypoxylon argillaceum]|nr:hypothetical protein GGS24DRAFT_51962 [Hypoxylon argillaceum]
METGGPEMARSVLSAWGLCTSTVCRYSDKGLEASRPFPHIIRQPKRPELPLTQTGGCNQGGEVPRYTVMRQCLDCIEGCRPLDSSSFLDWSLLESERAPPPEAKAARLYALPTYTDRYTYTGMPTHLHTSYHPPTYIPLYSVPVYLSAPRGVVIHRAECHVMRGTSPLLAVPGVTSSACNATWAFLGVSGFPTATTSRTYLTDLRVRMTPTCRLLVALTYTGISHSHPHTPSACCCVSLRHPPRGWSSLPPPPPPLVHGGVG